MLFLGSGKCDLKNIVNTGALPFFCKRNLFPDFLEGLGASSCARQVFDNFNISKRQETGRLLVDWYTHHARLALFALMVFFLSSLWK